MKLKPFHLFFLLALITIIFAFIWQSNDADIAMHDTYIVVNYFFILLPIAILSFILGLLYFVTEKLKRPISNKTGFWHFGLITLGLIISFNAFRGLILLMSNTAPDPSAFATDIIGILFLLGGPLLLISGIIVFTIGIIKAFVKKKIN